MVGKFGHKAQVGSLYQFSGDAYLNEIGITNPLFPSENCPQGDCALLAANPAPGLNDDGADITAFTNFMSLLAPPLPVELNAVNAAPIEQGQRLFASAGCAVCHTPTLRTGPSSHPARSRVEFHPYSDYLLHDMGALGDGIVQGDASAAEMRTVPLWGIHLRTAFLHDGRARDLSSAIAAHDGQGLAASRAFQQLAPAERQALLAFLGSL